MTDNTEHLRMIYYDLLPHEIRVVLAYFPDNVTNTHTHTHTQLVWHWWRTNGVAWTLDRIDQNRKVIGDV